MINNVQCVYCRYNDSFDLECLKGKPHFPGYLKHECKYFEKSSLKEWIPFVFIFIVIIVIVLIFLSRPIF